MASNNVLVSLRMHFLIASLLFLALPTVKNQSIGCSTDGIDLEQCMNQDTISLDKCCNAINTLVQRGFNCLCSLLTLSDHLNGRPVMFLLPNCYITIPPPNLCRLVGPMPVLFPPDMRNRGKEPPASSEEFPHNKPVSQPSAPKEIPIPQPTFPVLNSTANGDSTDAPTGSGPEESITPARDSFQEQNETSYGTGRAMVFRNEILLLLLCFQASLLPQITL